MIHISSRSYSLDIQKMFKNRVKCLLVVNAKHERFSDPIFLAPPSGWFHQPELVSAQARPLAQMLL